MKKKKESIWLIGYWAIPGRNQGYWVTRDYLLGMKND